MKHLRGLPVIDPSSARKLGAVVDYQIDPTTGHLAALDVANPASAEGERVLAHRIRRVGQHAVILTAEGGPEPGLPPTVDERWLDSATLSGLEVIGDDGNRVGRVADASFNQDSLEIEGYLLRSRFLLPLLGRPGRIPPSRVQACSRELMLVSSSRVKQLPGVQVVEPAPPGLHAPLKTDDRLPAPDFEQVPDGQTVSAHSS